MQEHQQLKPVHADSQIKTYSLSRSEKTGQDQIMCLKCGRVSHNLNDVINKYCGHCHVFHEN
ncbi:hypothetical protein FJM65_11250 [Pontibacter mangrovi]|uniref:Uncharacterized protein n=1 Tax=Pontibacter mangrovi TaxID=2589816 RepID=A0A501W7E0_9BACT|nr:hypothetical protein FJM65_11250 [Pontibacter mangrovi]